MERTAVAFVWVAIELFLVSGLGSGESGASTSISVSAMIALLCVLGRRDGAFVVSRKVLLEVS